MNQYLIRANELKHLLRIGPIRVVKVIIGTYLNLGALVVILVPNLQPQRTFLPNALNLQVRKDVLLHRNPHFLVLSEHF